jgi:exodeoxyribonuclease-3
LVAAARNALPGYTCELSLCRDPRNVRFRGGRAYGVATYVHHELAAAQHSLAWDLEGRVLITTLPAHGVAIVNVYAVNGTSKPYFDHELARIVGDRHAFKRRFNERLMEACAALRADGWSLVLIGDWNISRTKLDTYPRLRTEGPHALARELFNERFIPGLDLVDVFRELHPDARAYTWFSRAALPGKLDAARVDFALLSRSLLPRVVSAGILSEPAQRFGSDHAPLYVRLSV